MRRKELFLSHAASDHELAEFIELTARRCIPGIDVFRTTRTGQIAGGREWLQEIRRHLLSSDRFLILLTPASTARPWIWFETGAIWIRDLPFVPACAGGLTPSGLPEPLKSLQLLSLETTAEAVQAFTELGGKLDSADAFASRVHELSDRGKETALKNEGWTGLMFDQHYYAWDGPLEDLPVAQPVPLPERLINALNAEGWESRTGIDGDLMNEFSQGYSQVFRVDKWKRKRALVSRDKQILLVRPVPRENR